MNAEDLQKNDIRFWGIVKNRVLKYYSDYSCCLWAIVVDDEVKYLGETEDSIFKRINKFINWNNPSSCNFKDLHDFILGNELIEIYVKPMKSKLDIKKEKSHIKKMYKLKNTIK